MLDRLPIFIGPLNFADRRRELSGELALKSFPRLADMPENEQVKVTVALSFFKLGRIPAMSGELSTLLELLCQNCLQPINKAVTSKFKLAFITSLDEADQLPEGFEPYLYDGDDLALIDIVEEELLLALPEFPKHKNKCIDESLFKTDTVSSNTQSESDNPFSVLAKLKNTGD